MHHIIPHDIVQKIKEAQNNELSAIKAEAILEINNVVKKFLEELSKNVEKLISNPFNLYLKIPRTSNKRSLNEIKNDKIYLDELRKQYHKVFEHDMQISEGFFIMLINHKELICNGDPRPKQLMVENDLPKEDDELVQVNTIFNDSEKKKFESELELGKRPSLRSGFSGEKKDMLVPLFLQRRNSKLSLPTISARKAKEVSVSETEDSVV